MNRVTKDPADPGFPHGTERGYFRGCSEECCMTAKRRAHKRRDMLKDKGIRMTTDARPVREHLQALLRQHPLAGVTPAARACGVNQRTLALLDSGQTSRVRTITAEAVYALTLEAVLAEARLVPATRPRQQVQSLMRLGWPGSWISAELGSNYHKNTGPPQFFYKHGRRGEATAFVARDLAERIDVLYERIGDNRGPSWRTALYAAKRGWQVPGAYDDDGRLIPGSVRTEAYERDRIGEREDRREMREQIREYMVDHLDATASALGSRFGLSVRTIERYRAEIRAEDLGAAVDLDDYRCDDQPATREAA